MHKFQLKGSHADGGPRRRLSYANVTATLALVLVLGGGSALAASHYIITSTHQIKPSVLKSLRGHNGRNGSNGRNGANGLTGATGAVGAAGVAGAVGPAGAVGAAGPIGATGIVQTATFDGQIATSIAGSSTVFVFTGPTATVTTTATQRITGSATAPLGLASGGPQSVEVDLCYQVSTGGALTNFTGFNYAYPQVSTTRTDIPAAASVVPGAGTWNVGECVKNTNSLALANNDYVNGWVQVTN